MCSAKVPKSNVSATIYSGSNEKVERGADKQRRIEGEMVTGAAYIKDRVRDRQREDVLKWRVIISNNNTHG